MNNIAYNITSEELHVDEIHVYGMKLYIPYNEIDRIIKSKLPPDEKERFKDYSFVLASVDKNENDIGMMVYLMPNKLDR